MFRICLTGARNVVIMMIWSVLVLAFLVSPTSITIIIFARPENQVRMSLAVLLRYFLVSSESLTLVSLALIHLRLVCRRCVDATRLLVHCVPRMDKLSPQVLPRRTENSNYNNNMPKRLKLGHGKCTRGLVSVCLTAITRSPLIGGEEENDDEEVKPEMRGRR